jgi:ABC-type phosphate/phosphonate transport system substrate-binding protein
MSWLATLPMYDWPETCAETDARWAVLREALRGEGFDPPERLSRPHDPFDAWTAPDLLIGETCTFPLATSLSGKVRYVATPVHKVLGCGRGTYRSVIVRRKTVSVEPPASPDPLIDPDILSGSFAANMPDSLSGYVAIQHDCAALDIDAPVEDEVVWTGSHRASIRAVASGDADFAAIDCVTWAIALRHEPAAANLAVAGWTASRPALPLITSLAIDEDALRRMRRAIGHAIDSVVYDNPADI